MKPCIAHSAYQEDCHWCRSGVVQAKPRAIIEKIVWNKKLASRDDFEKSYRPNLKQIFVASLIALPISDSELKKKGIDIQRPKHEHERHHPKYIRKKKYECRIVKERGRYRLIIADRVARCIISNQQHCYILPHMQSDLRYAKSPRVIKKWREVCVILSEYAQRKEKEIEAKMNP